MYLAVRCQSGKEKRVINTFENFYAQQYDNKIKLHLLQREVQRVAANGKVRMEQEKILFNYVIAEINDMTFTEAYNALAHIGHVQEICSKEVTAAEFERMQQLAAGKIVQIAEPAVFNEKEYRQVKNEVKWTFDPKVKERLLARIEELRQQKRRYLAYLSALPKIIGHRIIKGKQAVYEFSQELLQVVEGRDYPEHHTGGRGDPVALVISLAQAST